MDFYDEEYEKGYSNNYVDERVPILLNLTAVVLIIAAIVELLRIIF